MVSESGPTKTGNFNLKKRLSKLRHVTLSVMIKQLGEDLQKIFAFFSFIIELIESMGSPNSAIQYPKWMGFACSLALFVASMMKSFFWNFAQYHQMCIGLRMKTAVIGTVYRKVSIRAQYYTFEYGIVFKVSRLPRGIQ